MRLPLCLTLFEPRPSPASPRVFSTPGPSPWPAPLRPLFCVPGLCASPPSSSTSLPRPERECSRVLRRPSLLCTPLSSHCLPVSRTVSSNQSPVPEFSPEIQVDGCVPQGSSPPDTLSASNTADHNWTTSQFCWWGGVGSYRKSSFIPPWLRKGSTKTRNLDNSMMSTRPDRWKLGTDGAVVNRFSVCR